jgi:hypothetical protein
VIIRNNVIVCDSGALFAPELTKLPIAEIGCLPESEHS